MANNAPDYHGQGPRMYRWAIAWAIASGLAAWIMPRWFVLRAPWTPWLGWPLLAAGAALFAPSLVLMVRAVRSKRLETGGPFRLVRHPMYASWALFLFPGLALTTGAWPILLSSVLTLARFDRWAQIEERTLEKTFGEAYRAYAARTPRLIPFAKPKT